MNKSVLFLIAVAFAFLIGMKVAGNNTLPSLTTAQASDFQSEINKDGAIIIDIRTPEEFESGRIAGATNIDYYSSDFKQKLEKLDKNKPYKIYCNSGNRSSKTLSLMKQMGFTDVVELGGGIQAWKSLNFPVCINC